MICTRCGLNAIGSTAPPDARVCDTCWADLVEEAHRSPTVVAMIARRDARIRELEALVAHWRKRAFDLAAELTALKHGKALEKVED